MNSKAIASERSAEQQVKKYKFICNSFQAKLSTLKMFWREVPKSADLDTFNWLITKDFGKIHT